MAANGSVAPPAFLARTLCLFFILLFASEAIVTSLRGPYPGVGSIYACFYIHLWLSIYDGGFGSRRKILWIALIIGWVGAMAAGFLSYVMPWGQAQMWSAAVFLNLADGLPGGRDWGPKAWEAFGAFSNTAFGQGFLIALSCLPVALLVFDIAVMHGHTAAGREDVAGSGRILRRLSPYVAVAIGASSAMLYQPVAPDDTLASLQAIMPQWYLLPFYAVLRAVPDKFGGVIAMSAVMIVPILLPWLASARYRLRPLRGWFQLGCLAIALGWFGLGWLGAQPPEADVIGRSQALTIWYFAFFLLVLPFFAAWARRRGKAEATAIAGAFD